MDLGWPFAAFFLDVQTLDSRTSPLHLMLCVSLSPPCRDRANVEGHALIERKLVTLMSEIQQIGCKGIPLTAYLEEGIEDEHHYHLKVSL